MIGPGEIIVDLFAGGGGASEGIHLATGREPDIAVNHDEVALGVHAANHPATHHHCTSIWNVEPRAAVAGRPVGLLWASPDCRHFSRAAGGQPRAKSVRALPGVVLTWATRVLPRVIVVENVREFMGWGPLLADGTPCPDRMGRSFRQWVGRLRGLGYAVQWRELCAADFGAPTVRTRLFVVARRDGEPIAWPQPTHGRRPGMFERPWRTAADCIDWSLPCRSIFDRARPLQHATMQRIARGVRRFVLDAREPFIVRIGHWSARTGEGFHFRGQKMGVPLGTITTFNDKALIVPSVAGVCKHALVAAFLAQHNGGATGHAAGDPLSTISTSGTQQNLACAFLAPITHHDRSGAGRGSALSSPVPTLTAAHRGEHALVEAALSADDGDGAHRVAAFLARYHGSGTQGQDLREPLGAVDTHGRYALVCVDGLARAIVDIGMRMLSPRELAAAQGFRPDYVLDRTADGAPVTKTAQIRLIGNSVCPDVAAALLRAVLGAAGDMRKAA